MPSSARQGGVDLLALLTESADPGAVTGQVLAYGKSVTGVTQLFTIASDGTVQQITGGGGMVPATRTINTTAPITGGGTLAADLTLALAANGITNALFRQGAGLSVVGVTGNATANVADIVAGADGGVFRRAGTALGFGDIPEGSVTNLVSDLALKAPLASPTFTGTPAAPTATAGTNTTQLATTAFVQAGLATPINNVSAVLQNVIYSSGAAGTKNYGDSVGGAVYLGRLPVALAAASVQILYRTTTALVIGTTGTRYAEIGLATGSINPGGNPTLTTRFTVDASASGTTGMQGTAGPKNTTMTGVTLAAGVDLWLIFGWATGTGGGASGAVFRSAANVDDLNTAMLATRAAYQPSANVGSPLAFTNEGAAAVPLLARLVLP